MLSDDGIARLLVLVHAHLQRARCVRHKHASLGPLKALLLLLDDAVAAPYTFRYACHILLQCLHVPCAPFPNLSFVTYAPTHWLGAACREGARI